jgi:uncharacterized protein YndB with AHSA1/START domain
MPNTVRLHRVLATKPDKIYRAFIEADAMAKWLPPNGFTCTVHHFDAKAGGAFKMSFRNFTTGMSHSFGGEFLELVPGERLRYTDKFDDPNLPGEIQVTVTLRAVTVGTEVNIEQAGIPDAIPVEACYLGWQQSLRNLAKLVELESTNRTRCDAIRQPELAPADREEDAGRVVAQSAPQGIRQVQTLNSSVTH